MYIVYSHNNFKQYFKLIVLLNIDKDLIKWHVEASTAKNKKRQSLRHK